MRERAEEIGGTFTVLAVPDAGTTVRAFLPTAARAPLEPGQTDERDDLDDGARVMEVRA
jgi:signal transduction histidine kinase